MKIWERNVALGQADVCGKESKGYIAGDVLTYELVIRKGSMVFRSM